jgi:hypothetical protein
MLLFESKDNSLVFLVGEGAGAVRDDSARFKHVIGKLKKLALAFGVGFDFGILPILLGCFVLSHHRGTAAWGVEDDLIKGVAEVDIGEDEVGGGNNDVSATHSLDVLRHFFGSWVRDIVRDDAAFAIHGDRATDALSARGGAHIEDDVIFLWLEEVVDHHRAGILDAIDAGKIIEARSEIVFLFVVIIGVLNKRVLPDVWKTLDEFLIGNLVSVNQKTVGDFALFDCLK